MSVERVCTRDGIPALWASGGGGTAVLVLHGWAASKESHAKELALLAEAGFDALAPDAPGHGERVDGRVERLEKGRRDRWHEGFLELVGAQAAEMPALAGELRERGAAKVAAVGISMGACVALSAQATYRCFDAVSSLLGTPELEPRATARRTRRLDELLARAPAKHLEAFARLPLLLANGGLDEHVPPHASRRFAKALRERFGPEACDYLEYPRSGHFMRPEDWEDLWRNATRFLARL